MTKEMQIVVFKLDKEEYGIDIGKVREIVRVQNITKIPGCAPHVEGMVNLRGHIVPVVDLKKKFFKNAGTSIDEQDEKDGHRRMIVVNIEAKDVGILVSSVTEILRVPGENMENAPSAGGNMNAEYIAGVAKVDNRLIVVLELEKIFSETEKEGIVI